MSLSMDCDGARRSFAFSSSAKSRVMGLPAGPRVAPRASLAFSSSAKALLLSFLIVTSGGARDRAAWSTLTARLLAADSL